MNQRVPDAPAVGLPPERRSFLFLQGVPGPFFAALGRALARNGHEVHRVNFNGGDRLSWTLPGAVDFRGSRHEWPAFLGALIRERGVTDIVLFGDCRPLHREAVSAGAEAGLRVHVWEEGYLRPHWATLEEGGVNGYSAMPRDPAWYLAEAERLPPPPPAAGPPDTFGMRARACIGYGLAQTVLAWRFRRYVSHRPWHPLREATGWLFKLAARPAAHKRLAAASSRIAGREVFLFPLQLDSDTQIGEHSGFCGIAEAADTVIRSFAAHAPLGAVLAVKSHPLDNGLISWRETVEEAAERHGAAERVVYLEGGDLGAMLRTARGMVTVNSTSGLQAAAAGVPVAVLGRAVYDIPGLTFQGRLDEFWRAPLHPDPALFEAFRKVVEHRCLVRGGFFGRRSAEALASAAVPRIEAASAPQHGAWPLRDAPPAKPGPIWLDLSRLLWRAARGSLTGIDRVELAYAAQLEKTVPWRLGYVAMNCAGRITALPRRDAARFVRAVAAGWRDGDLSAARRLAVGLSARALFSPSPRPERNRGRPVYLLVSHHHLHRTGVIRRLLSATGAAFVPLVHDLIPLTHPEYARPSEEERHRARMETVRQLADAVIVNSDATADSLAGFLGGAAPVVRALLGADSGACPAPEPAAGQPYFVMVGTIEPRKNHLTLLHLWRRLGERLGRAAPRLVIIGRRGWENENILDLLERCPALKGHVDERSGLPDQDMRRLLAGSRALLMPSFVEGYGLPVAEALAMGVPVVCSDIPAHREIGREVPDYIDPLDGPGWEAAVLDYTGADSPMRAAQLGRLRCWKAPTWEAHVSAALRLADRAAAAPARAQKADVGVQGDGTAPGRVPAQAG